MDKLTQLQKTIIVWEIWCSMSERFIDFEADYDKDKI